MNQIQSIIKCLRMCFLYVSFINSEIDNSYVLYIPCLVICQLFPLKNAPLINSHVYFFTD